MNLGFLIKRAPPFRFLTQNSCSASSCSTISTTPPPSSSLSPGLTCYRENQDSDSRKGIGTALPSGPAADFVGRIQPLLRSIWSLITSIPPSSARSSAASSRTQSGCPVTLFRPYVAKVPWHGGVRAFLSQLFPRYGHYCGPNWSSGKDGGSLLWDRRPIDWLDFCCYCHDIGYDTHDQVKLLKADLAFLECLERPRMPTKGDACTALLYKSMCIAGLRNILIPYRMQLVRLQGGPSLVELMSSLIGKNATCNRNEFERSNKWEAGDGKIGI